MKTLDPLAKLKILGEGAKYDVCASTATRVKKPGQWNIGATAPSGICHSFTPDGRCISLFKVLLTNYCEKDCAYCPNRAGRDVARTKFAADELAGLFMEFYRRNYVEGLFLSSGVTHSTGHTMSEILKVAEVLRSRYKFGGYIHLKILPGATDTDVAAAMRFANRVSLNMEAPSAAHLARLSSSKNFTGEILDGMAKISRHLKEQPGVSHSTQYIVGAAQEADRDILQSVTSLYHQYNLKRAYFSAFQPVDGTPLATVGQTPLLRENRLYQSDFLLRLYGFRYSDLVFDTGGNLDQDLDPKLAYALHHPEIFPLEINKASFQDLLKVPGLGPRSAAKIVRVRREYRFTQPAELKNAGLVLKRALSFITIDGRFYGDRTKLVKPNRQNYTQLSLWGDTRDHLLTVAMADH
ncbi:putative DNA modification/repair radical SAM protein [uncultured Sporomusa sp.]|nr:putative DNA modification/repair radical SAM protein [uncultured Sporomusa sp.]